MRGPFCTVPPLPEIAAGKVVVADLPYYSLTTVLLYERDLG